jgi:hypothetical protein
MYLSGSAWQGMAWREHHSRKNVETIEDLSPAALLSQLVKPKKFQKKKIKSRFHFDNAICDINRYWHRPSWKEC